jgi:parallel beta-helix repeat protein
MEHIKISGIRSLVVFVGFLLLLPSVGGTQAVDCDLGESLQAAIDGAGTEATITVSGTCNENVTIREEKDSITLDGQGIATINGPDPTDHTIFVRGRGITIRGITITGGRNGIFVSRGGTALIDTNTIQNTGNNGILLNQESSARIINNTIQNNPNAGIVVSENSSARIGFLAAQDTVASPNTIQNNSDQGIIVSRSSSARIVGNTISNNGLASGSDGIIVTRASQADISSNTIDGNGRHGIFLTLNSAVSLGDDTGDTIFDLPNSTTEGSENGDRGIRCVTGGAVDGRLGTLNGTMGATLFAVNCINSLNP